MSRYSEIHYISINFIILLFPPLFTPTRVLLVRLLRCARQERPHPFGGRDRGYSRPSRPAASKVSVCPARMREAKNPARQKPPLRSPWLRASCIGFPPPQSKRTNVYAGRATRSTVMTAQPNSPRKPWASSAEWPTSSEVFFLGTSPRPASRRTFKGCP